MDLLILLKTAINAIKSKMFLTILINLFFTVTFIAIVLITITGTSAYCIGIKIKKALK